MNTHKYPVPKFGGEAFIIQSCELCGLERKKYIGGFVSYKNISGDWVTVCPRECIDQTGIVKLASNGEVLGSSKKPDLLKEIKNPKEEMFPGLLKENEWDKEDEKITVPEEKPLITDTGYVKGLRHIFEKGKLGEFPCLVCGCVMKRLASGSSSYQNIRGKFYPSVPHGCLDNDLRKRLISNRANKHSKPKNIIKPEIGPDIKKTYPGLKAINEEQKDKLNINPHVYKEEPREIIKGDTMKTLISLREDLLAKLVQTKEYKEWEAVNLTIQQLKNYGK